MEQQKTAPPDVRAAVDYLRGSKSGLKSRVGVLNGKRIDYFKGKSAVKALLQPAFAKLKAAPKVATEAEAIALLQRMLPFAFYLRVERGASTGGSSSPKHIQINPQQMFRPEDYYAWFYEGSQWTTYVGGVIMVAVILAGVMFPLWPPFMHRVVWYLSMGVLGLIGVFIALAIFRLIFYIITIIVASPGIWIFPQLFADVGFVDSFIPLWEWDIPKKKGKKKKNKEKEKKGEAEKENVPPATGSAVPRTQYASIEEVEDDD